MTLNCHCIYNDYQNQQLKNQHCQIYLEFYFHSLIQSVWISLSFTLIKFSLNLFSNGSEIIKFYERKSCSLATQKRLVAWGWMLKISSICSTYIIIYVETVIKPGLISLGEKTVAV